MMNKRIKEIADDCGLYIAYDNKAVTDRELEFFAEQIIKECARIAEEVDGDSRVRSSVLEYFGIDLVPQDPRATESVAKYKCWCYNCLDEIKDSNGWSVTMYTFIVCPDCGCKRCPKSTDHKLACTNSNEPGQPGSRY